MCHQTVGLAARHLEAHGIPTVIMGCAKDIVEHCGVPRFLWSDFPLGNSAGRPFDVESQAADARAGAARPRDRAGGPDHRAVAAPLDRRTRRGSSDFLDLAKLSPDEIAERRKEFDVVKAVAKAKREGT